MAEALGKLLAVDVFERYSAGTEIKPEINPDAVRLVKARYGVDMSQSQRSKLLSDLPPVDMVVTMGCNVSCPSLPCEFWEDWGLEYPTGKPDEAFLAVMDDIGRKVLDLNARLQARKDRLKI